MDAPAPRATDDRKPHEPDTARIAREQVARSNFDLRTGAMVTLAVLAVFYTFYFAAELILPLVFALVFDLLLQPFKRFLTNRLRFPAALAALLLLVLLLVVILGIATALSLPASSWIAKAPQSLPALQQRLSFLSGPAGWVQHGLQQLQQLSSGGGGHDQQQQQVAVQQGNDYGGLGLSVLHGTRMVLGNLLTFSVVLVFLLASGDTVMRRIVEVLPSFDDKRRVVDIADQIERNVSSYLALITIMNLLVGTANGLSMWLLGMPDPLLWGTLAFLLNYIPILGPFTGVVIFFFVGLLSGAQLWRAFLPPVIYLVIHMIEGETVTPALLARRMTLNPVLVIVSLFFWDFVWGVPGAFLAVPLLAIAKVVCDRIPSLTPIGHVLGGKRD